MNHKKKLAEIEDELQMHENLCPLSAEYLISRVRVLTEALEKFDMPCYTCGSDEIARKALNDEI